MPQQNRVGITFFVAYVPRNLSLLFLARRYADSALYASNAGVAATYVRCLQANDSSPGFYVQSPTGDGATFEYLGGGLVMLSVGSCVPQQDGPLTFLRFRSCVDVADEQASQKRLDVLLVIPLGQMLLSQVSPGEIAVFHITSMDVSEDKVELSTVHTRASLCIFSSFSGCNHVVWRERMSSPIAS